MNHHNLKRAVIYISLLLLGGYVGRAGFVMRPDTNTLWVEDGSAGGVVSSNQATDGKLVRTAPAGQAGFTLCPTTNTEGYTTRKVPVDPLYPWLVLNITGIVPHQGGGYRAFNIRLLQEGTLSLGMAGTIQKGLYAIPLLPRAVAAAGDFVLRIGVSGADVTLDELKMVQKPDYYIVMESPAILRKGRLEIGDELTFRVIMAAPAEDVTLRLYDSYTAIPVALNGLSSLQLKPEPADRRVWRTTLTLEKTTAGGAARRGGTFPPGILMIKATVLGGGIRTPLWTVNACEWRLGR